MHGARRGAPRRAAPRRVADHTALPHLGAALAAASRLAALPRDAKWEMEGGKARWPRGGRPPRARSGSAPAPAPAAESATFANLQVPYRHVGVGAGGNSAARRRFQSVTVLRPAGGPDVFTLPGRPCRRRPWDRCAPCMQHRIPCQAGWNTCNLIVFYSVRIIASLPWTLFTSLLTHRLVLLCIDDTVSSLGSARGCPGST